MYTETSKKLQERSMNMGTKAYFSNRIYKSVLPEEYVSAIGHALLVLIEQNISRLVQLSKKNALAQASAKPPFT
jgi:hypothetical protein